MTTRREFLRYAAGVAGAAMIPPSIARALAIPAHRATGTIQDVEHVVILMQENRSFDHYFGTLRGVRGFGDTHAARLPSGWPVWFQPTASVKTHRYHNRGLHRNAQHVLPFYLNPKRTTEFQAGTDHGWSSGHGAANHGHWDRWVTQKQDVLTMGYLKREDVAFHYALADAFTICDAYHCSVHANTVMNRFYLWTGTMDPRNVLGKKPNGPGFEERGKKNGYTWTTYPERLQAQGISWKVYQGGTGEPGSPTDNYTDNSLEFFAQYQVEEGASPSDPLVIQGVTDRTLAGLRSDVVSGRLPQVSWVVAPFKYCEHPDASPRDGAYYINMVLEALTVNPEVWSRTVFILNYDENDGLFDHIVPPMPPLTQATNAQGLVSPDLVEAIQDELIDMDKYPHQLHPLVPGSDPGGIQPIGLGPRVPLLIISPWTTGGWVCSQTFDHTSVLQFLEARFGIAEPNINAWRRSICGDLTSAFDFAGTAQPAVTNFVVPAPLVSQHRPYSVPAVQTRAQQEPGTRPARAVPYVLATRCRLDAAEGKVWIDMENTGRAGAAFHVRNSLQPHEPPRRYSVSAGQTVSDCWPIAKPRTSRETPWPGLGYDLRLHGPNGFCSYFRGVPPALGIPSVRASIRCDQESGDAILILTNESAEPVVVTTTNDYARNELDSTRQLTLAPQATLEDRWLLHSSFGWFDLWVTLDARQNFLRRFAGHVETGRPGRSDPRFSPADHRDAESSSGSGGLV